MNGDWEGSELWGHLRENISGVLGQECLGTSKGLRVAAHGADLEAKGEGA